MCVGWCVGRKPGRSAKRAFPRQFLIARKIRTLILFSFFYPSQKGQSIHGSIVRTSKLNERPGAGEFMIPTRKDCRASARRANCARVRFETSCGWRGGVVSRAESVETEKRYRGGVDFVAGALPFSLLVSLFSCVCVGERGKYRGKSDM